MTALTKFDGNRVRRFTVREFHQLAGAPDGPGTWAAAGLTSRTRVRYGFAVLSA